LKRQILYLFRKPERFFSIENVFNRIVEEIERKGELTPSRAAMPREGFSIAVIWENGRFARRKASDIYHITGDIHYVSFFLPPKKTVLTIHDCVFMYRSKGIKRWVLKKLLLDWPVARCGYVTAISENTKRDIVKFTGCPSGAIRVIPNPVSDKIISEPRPPGSGRPVLLFIGSTPNKNLPRVIEALKGVHCILDIVGRIPPQELAQIREAGIEYRNYLNLSDEEMAVRYIECDIVLFPSTYEGFGMPIVEGQKAGRPVLTSNLSPMKEVAGEGACLVDPLSPAAIRQGLIKMVEDNVYREMLVKRGLENVRNYELGHIAGMYQSLYKEILKEV